MKYQVDEYGYFGEFGGSYIPEMLYPPIRDLQGCYREVMDSEEFQKEFQTLLSDYVGRPSPLYLAERLSQHLQSTVYLKREDLNHTGSHKINNTVGQILLAQRLGKRRIIAETGAGQHGVATATVCARMGMECTVFMGEVDTQRQAANVNRMKFLGADIVVVRDGSRVLKDATNAALRDWISHPTNTHYIIGSVVGPHPYPDMVARFQSVISKELRSQLLDQIGQEIPTRVVACVGGGSNSIGGFYHFLDEPSVELIAVEAGGKGVDSDMTAATTAKGKPGILHGSKTLLLQNEEGQVQEAHSLSAGLDYPGIGPQHAHLYETGRVRYLNVTDDEAVTAALELARFEGIIPALESAHALAILPKLPLKRSDSTVLILSGNGEKDMATYQSFVTQESHDHS